MNHAVVEDYLSELMALEAPAPSAPAAPTAGAAPASPPCALADPVAMPSHEAGPLALDDALHAPVAAATVGPVAIAACAPRPAVVAPVVARTPQPPRDDVRADADADDALARRRRAADQVTTWLRFRIGSQACAVEVLRVQEVLRLPEIVPVRGAPAHVIGLMNLRGQLVAVLDVAKRLGLDAPPWSPTEESRVIVLEHGGQALGLRVDAVADVARVGGSAVERVRGPLLGASGEILRGVARLDGTTIVLLDAVALLG